MSEDFVTRLAATLRERPQRRTITAVIRAWIDAYRRPVSA